MAPKTQKAIVLTEIGKPVSLSHSWPIPQVKASQVLLKVTIASANPMDQKGRDYGLFTADKFPYVGTADVVGRVVEMGSGVTKYSIGDRIMGQGNIEAGCPQNGLQEHAVLDVDFSCKIVDEVSDEEAATMPINCMTAMLALFKALAIPTPWSPEESTSAYKNSTILIVGGGSNTGIFAVQWAALAGLGFIITVGGDKDFLTSLGATHVVSRRQPADQILKHIRDIVDDDLLLALDTVNMPDGQTLAVNALSSTKRGKFARLVPAGPVPEALLHSKKAGYDLIDVMGSGHASPDFGKSFWALLPQYLREGKIKATKYKVLDGWSADNVNAVYDSYRDEKPTVKTHFRFS